MRDRLQEALKASTADYAEIRVETEDSTHLGYRGPEVEHVASGCFQGGLVRACTRGGWGVVTFDSLDELEGRVREACACAALVGQEETALAPVPPVEITAPAQLTRDPRGIPLDEKLALTTRYNQLILDHDPRIESSNVFYSDTFRVVHFASTEGAYFMEERPRIVLYASATARDGSLVQRAGESISSATTYDCVLGMEEKITAAAARAVALLDAPPCPGGPTTVVLDPRLGGVFVHEAFGHLSEADFLYENPKMKELMCLGRTMGEKELNIVDDGSLGSTIGTHAVDDEGTPTRKVYLIKEGVLSGHLHSRETAAKMGAEATGNARSINRSAVPIVRMTNTYIEGGDLAFTDMIKDIDDGIYACHMVGGQTMMEMFTFSAGHGYRIKNGEVAELVRDVTLTGNVFETLKSIDGYGDDFTLIEGGGGCGKGGQSPLPVTFGSPHLRIRDVVIGGRQ
ncbi:MAG: TldD/PmbA family protein [Planctomycetota bacterium]|jgi:TldD protein